METYVSINQSGFKRNRSTSDILWAYKWIQTIADKYQEEFHIMGIDLSKAFDCINRQMLLDKLAQLLDESSLRIITYLLADTELHVKLDGKIYNKFKTTIGTPQGDALSPILFIIYLEMAFRYHKEHFDATYANILHTPEARPSIIQEDIEYADDTDFIDQQPVINLFRCAILPDDLKRFNLQMNAEKTEYTIINRETHHTNGTKKLGSLLSEEQDIKRRINLANQKFGLLTKVWFNKKQISIENKLRMYNAMIRPILLYNTSTYGITIATLEPLQAAHRKHLRKIAGIFHPEKITNLQLYERLNQKPLIFYIKKDQWQLFGHILRRPEIPAYKMMQKYFDLNNTQGMKKYRGRTPYNILGTLQHDLKRTHESFKNSQDLTNIALSAQNRAQWRTRSLEIANYATRTYLAEMENKRAERKRKREMEVIIIAHHQDPEGNQPRRQRIRLFIDEQRPLTLRISRGGRIAAPQAPADQGRGDMMDLDE